MKSGKKAFIRDKLHKNTGTVGHVDHGKTTLAAAIKSFCDRYYLKSKDLMLVKDIDKSPEEKVRGITINATVLSYETEKTHYSHVDCPGHADYIKNMITGAAQMDVAILVVASTDGLMLQTREHIILARQIGVKNIVVFLNKCDANDDADMLELIEEEIKEELEKNTFEGCPFIRGSGLVALTELEKNVSEENGSPYGIKAIRKLMETLDSLPAPERPVNEPFLMPIESTVQIPGRGSVIAGTVESGHSKLGDEFCIIGLEDPKVVAGRRQKFVATGMESFRKTLEYVEAGDNVGVLLRGLGDEARRGKCLVLAEDVEKKNLFQTHQFVRVNAYITNKNEGGRKNGFTSGYRPQAHFKTADLPVTVYLNKKNEIALPGDNLDICLRFDLLLPVKKGDRIALREGGLTVASVVITEIFSEIPSEYAYEGKKKSESAAAAA